MHQRIKIMIIIGFGAVMLLWALRYFTIQQALDPKSLTTDIQGGSESKESETGFNDDNTTIDIQTIDGDGIEQPNTQETITPPTPGTGTGITPTQGTGITPTQGTWTAPIQTPGTLQNPATWWTQNQILRLYIPYWIPNNDHEQLEEIGKLVPWITVLITQAAHEAEYRYTLEQWILNPQTPIPYELVIVPSTRLKEISMHLRNITFSTDITPIYAPYLRDIMIMQPATFIPYALDPLVTIIKNQWSLLPPPSNPTHQQLVTRARDIPPRNVAHLPMWFGFDTQELSLLRLKRFPFHTYNDIALTIVQQALTIEEASIINLYKAIPQRSVSKIRTIIATISERLPLCSRYIIWCMVRFWLIDNGFIYLSDVDRIQEFLPQGNIRQRNYTIHAFPSRSLDFPIRARGISAVTTKDKTIQQGTAQWIQAYLQYTNQQRFVSESYTLSPLNAVRYVQSSQPLYINLSKQLQYWFIMRDYKSLSDRLWSNDAWHGALEGIIATTEFFRAWKNQ
jgi:hypothetical protein